MTTLPLSATAPLRAVDPRPASAEDGVEESVHVFAGNLVGVLTQPPGGTRARAALVLLNAGLTHRMGPFRLYVQMARVLAAQGFTVFRFDQSGLGDSALSTQVTAGRVMAETTAAMDLVTSLTGVREFVLGGLCSGANDAFNIAPEDARVAGLLLLDGVGYRTPGYHLRHYLPRLLRPASIWGYFRRRLGPPRDTPPPELDDFSDFPTRAEAARRLEALDARGVQALLLYTGGVGDYYNHRSQARACFGAVMRSPGMATDYWPECDHTFYLRAHREKLFQAVSQWMLARFGA
ncbi:alpha/beta hydrolase [Luteimonas sp. MC1782]|uniref:alpha/beta hydrolase n=1 Tax=Luteimonas sp. MC1782 TaxID=2760305 RepID=UPI00160418CC|nr:alpha/beta hydrolase [Luteimonas sp. MC1782]MBB1473149.1 alpha/beta hydrolase [Luteimonas sp. MC1782]